MKRRLESRTFWADSNNDARRRVLQFVRLLFDMRLLASVLPRLAVLNRSRLTSHDQSSMRSSSMRFAPHSTEVKKYLGNAERVSPSPHLRDRGRFDG